jgi:biopolymer transport protein TolR
MGMNIQPSSGSSSGPRKAYRPMSEINVTPFIDVMLVLLIVFMVTAPLLTTGVQVDLPKAQSGPVHEENEKPIEITVDKSGDIFLGETKVTKDELISKMSAISQQNVEKRVFIRGDQALSYGEIMSVIGMVTKAGYRKVALISDPNT